MILSGDPKPWIPAFAGENGGRDLVREIAEEAGKTESKNFAVKPGFWYSAWYMKKAVLLPILLLAVSYVYRLPLQKNVSEKWIAFSGREFLQGPVRLQSAWIDRSLQIHLRHLELTFKSEDGPAPIVLETLDSTRLIPGILTGGQSTFTFSGLKGMIPSRFFDGLLPYLPNKVAKKQVMALAEKSEMMAFQEGELRLETVSAKNMKVFLHMLIPDYNVALNINFDIRLEEAESLRELLRLLS